MLSIHPLWGEWRRAIVEGAADAIVNGCYTKVELQDDGSLDVGYYHFLSPERLEELKLQVGLQPPGEVRFENFNGAVLCYCEKSRVWRIVLGTSGDVYATRVGNSRPPTGKWQEVSGNGAFALVGTS